MEVMLIMSALNLTGFTDVKRILDPVVRNSGKDTDDLERVRQLMEAGWWLCGCLACGDHLVWVLGQKKFLARKNQGEVK
jgi:hypothetical protein